MQAAVGYVGLTMIQPDTPLPDIELTPQYGEIPHLKKETIRVNPYSTGSRELIHPQERKLYIPPEKKIVTDRNRSASKKQTVGPDDASVEDTTKHRGAKTPKRWHRLYDEVVNFYIAKMTPTCCLPKSTIRWCRNSSDERAAQEGMRFNEDQGQWVIDWTQRHCILYEGSAANTPLICDDWQFEYYMQLFGWQRFSQEISERRGYEAWVRRFTEAGIWIAKKNAKSPTLAATGLFMFVGEGEQGQHCYSVAKDGGQALISHTHVMEMVRNSPNFSDPKSPMFCKIKMTDYSIHHRASKSTYTIVHASNTRTAKAREGLNGSKFVDEVHVVDREQMDRVKRSGISREEPLSVEMSTAGNTPDGYGYERYEYGQKVSNPQRDEDYNPRFLFIDFSINQKATLSQLRDEGFVRSIAPICNPTLGRILYQDEFMADWKDSLPSDTELRKFAMYRLNLWLKDSASWVELTDWLNCAISPLQEEIKNNEGEERQYTLEDLKDYPCVAGLDMSIRKDMASLCLIFCVPDDHLGVRPYTWHWHWLPKETARAYSGKIDFACEDFKEFINLIPERTITYERVALKLEWIRANFDLRWLGYDIFNAVPVMRMLIAEYGWDENIVLKVPQTMRVMGPITKEVESWIVTHTVHHANNLLLNWQFQHVALDNDKHGNYHVVKPESNDYRKVDGIVSMLIAAVALTADFNLWTRDAGGILLYDRKEVDRDNPNARIDVYPHHDEPAFMYYHETRKGK